MEASASSISRSRYRVTISSEATTSDALNGSNWYTPRAAGQAHQRLVGATLFTLGDAERLARGDAGASQPDRHRVPGDVKASRPVPQDREACEDLALEAHQFSLMVVQDLPLVAAPEVEQDVRHVVERLGHGALGRRSRCVPGHRLRGARIGRLDGQSPASRQEQDARGERHDCACG